MAEELLQMEGEGVILTMLVVGVVQMVGLYLRGTD
jgi:hypothetical protein